ncbi:16S rRNA (adenine(1518)-N(6)/adenine(1519)-N(6))-dimethyltransferase RsmA [Salibacteraceae bacterium]|nr:16S rRNA (adenine(1518)-N(6)/adenine(1519)-N(6))-dimethyltransferase RsmA [Salibacteraceae bacterium]
MVKPKKSLGQHFLTDESVIDRMVEAIDELDIGNLIEIGPGEGVLSKDLIPKYPEMSLIELDRESVAHLRNLYPYLNERLIEADVLKWDLPEGQWTIVGNFPYNISSQIIFKMIENRTQVPALVGMFQKEVAERIVAPSGSKTYGILSVLTQAFYRGEYLFTVDEHAFRPPPRVKSGVIKLVRKESLELNCDVPFFFAIVKQAFNQRRKMLRNSVKSFLTESNLPLVEEYLTMRPEQLDVEDFVKLAQHLKP